MLKCVLSVTAIALLVLSSLAAAEPPLIELEHVATVDIPGQSYGIDVADGYVYAVTSVPGALHIIDASDPRNASIVRNSTKIADSNRVFVSDGRAYVGTDNALLVFDITKPEETVLLGYYMPFGKLQAAAGPYAFYTSYEPDGFGIIDASDPTNITKAGYYTYSDGRHLQHHPRSVVLKNDLAFVLDRMYKLENFLWVINISNPYYLQQEGSYSISAEYNKVGALSCNSLIVGSDILRAIDVSDPSNPREIGNYDDLTANKMVIDDYYAFITPPGSIRVEVIDVIDPTDMALTFSINSSFRYITGMEVDNGYLFVSQRDNQNDSSYLHIYRIDDHRLLPDLAFVDDALQLDRTAIMRREVVRMNATVINSGPGPTAFALATLSDGHETIASFKVPPLKANETWEIVYEIANLTKGEHTFNLTISQECDRSESRTDNNRVTASVRVVDFTQSTPSFALTWGQLVLASVLFAFLGGRRRIS